MAIAYESGGLVDGVPAAFECPHCQDDSVTLPPFVEAFTDGPVEDPGKVVEFKTGDGRGLFEGKV